MDFKGKIAVVTGASSGIGRATAELLGARGADVIVHYRRNQSGAEEAVRQIRAAGSRAVAIGADVCNVSEIHRLREQAHRELGPIDILINNAGGLVERRLLRDMTEQTYQQVMDLNVKSLIFVTQAFLPDMIEKGRGAIVNMASIAGRNGGGPGAGVYAASKAAAICLTKAMAKEFLEYGIRVNAVNPGVIETPFHEQFTSAEMMERFRAAIPLGRTGRSDEVAEVIVFLASEQSSYLVGESIEINGGLLMD